MAGQIVLVNNVSKLLKDTEVVHTLSLEPTGPLSIGDKKSFGKAMNTIDHVRFFGVDSFLWPCHFIHTFCVGCFSRESAQNTVRTIREPRSAFYITTQCEQRAILGMCVGGVRCALCTLCEVSPESGCIDHADAKYSPQSSYYTLRRGMSLCCL